MLLNFLDELRGAGLRVGAKEHLTLLEALDADVAERSAEAFYYLARSTYVKDEGQIDRFDQVFARVFKGVLGEGTTTAEIPEEWLRQAAAKYLTEEERAAIEAIGDWDRLMETLAERLKEQQERHEGGSKWIGTGGTSPFGNGGYNPEGVRIGGEGRHKRAVKVWEKREFRNFDNERELGTRTIKIALRRLRRFAREGRADELDLDATVDGTARQGWLDIRMRPERHNAVKLLLFLDVGGSMDPHVRVVEELFSAATSANSSTWSSSTSTTAPMRALWKDNRRRFAERTPTWDVLHKFGHDHKLVFVGDAAMSPYELTHPGGSVEHMNQEAGATWLARLTRTYLAAAWLNPVPEEQWAYSGSIGMVRELMEGRMFPLTLAGLDDAMRELGRKR